MKRIKFGLLLMILLSIFLVRGVSAKSDYYDFIWASDEQAETGGYATYDMIKVDDGFLVVGSSYDIPVIKLLDKEGNFVKEVSINSDILGRLKRVFAIDDGYVVIGVYDGNVFAMTLNSKYKVVDINGNWFEGDWDWSEIYAVKLDNHIYIFNSSNLSSAIIDYSIEDESFDGVTLGSLPKATRDVLNKYFAVMDYDSCYYIADGGGNGGFIRSVAGDNRHSDELYCNTFIKPYNDGYVFGLYDWGTEKSLIVYYTDEEVFAKTYSDIYIRDGVQSKGKLILLASDYDNETSELIVLDETGKKLDSESVLEYIDSNSYMGTSLIGVDDGFIVAGSVNTCSDGRKKSSKYSASDGEEPINQKQGNYDYECYNDKLLYFSSTYAIGTKTDGNGEITVNKIVSQAGELIEFTIEPKEGYILGVVKVTDAQGNVIEFNSNKFTMPSADVTIEVTFIKEPINPGTITGLGLALIAIVAVASGYYAIKQKKRLA